MNIDAQEIDLEYIEHDAEDHLTPREALMLGVEPDTDGADHEVSEWAC
jgi:hypothetical protein